jgi:hypothetical protein
VKGCAEVVLRLGERGGPVKLVEIHRMKTSDMVRAVRLVEESKDDLLAIWEAIHGE